MRPSNNIKLPSFRCSTDGNLWDYVEHAFLSRFHVDPVNLPTEIKSPSGLTYKCFYERFPYKETEPVEVLASFQAWKDGSKWVVIRPYSKDKPQRKQQ